jgi:type II secretory pathway component PulJ
VVEEFNKLAQNKSVNEHVERFEELKSLMNALNRSLPKLYYISSFASGLKDDVMLKILKLTMLVQTLHYMSREGGWAMF